jgi:hypothetical protein
MLEANRYTRDKLELWGLEGARLEPWGPFGRGWSFSHVSAHVVEPRSLPLIALPQAWTPGTQGAVRGELVRIDLDRAEDLEALRGRVRGKILLADDVRPIVPTSEPVFQRHDQDALAQLAEFDLDVERSDRAPSRHRQRERYELRRLRNRVLAEEGVLGVLRASSFDDALLRVGGAGSRWVDESAGVPELVIAAEQYNLLCRLLERGTPVTVELEVATRFHDGDSMAYNTLAEIPGTDLAHELVMVGAHLDSWHGATGATDNAAGVAVAMEAVRILRAIEVAPRRTIRIALWSGEEQGLLGSRAYVDTHFAAAPLAEDEEARRLPPSLREPGPLTYHRDYQRLSAYFNLDNGSGRIRGIYTQQNAAVRPIFERWLEPFSDLGASTVSLNNTGGTDHLAFDRVGLPGFQFIQDRLDYSTRTHHSNVDTLDHVEERDLKQAAMIMASFLYHAAARDALLPRKPSPDGSQPRSVAR